MAEMKPTKAELEAECDDLYVLLEDVLNECERSGCRHSAEVEDRIAELFDVEGDDRNPFEDDPDVIDVTPMKRGRE